MMWGFGETWGGGKGGRGLNKKQIWGNYSLLNNETFKPNLGKDMGKGEVEVWVEGKGDDDGYSRAI